MKHLAKFVLFNDTTRAHWFINHWLLGVKYLQIVLLVFLVETNFLSLLVARHFYMHFPTERTAHTMTFDVWVVGVVGRSTSDKHSTNWGHVPCHNKLYSGIIIIRNPPIFYTIMPLSLIVWLELFLLYYRRMQKYLVYDITRTQWYIIVNFWHTKKKPITFCCHYQHEIFYIPFPIYRGAHTTSLIYAIVYWLEWRISNKRMDTSSSIHNPRTLAN